MLLLKGTCRNEKPETLGIATFLRGSCGDRKARTFTGHMGYFKKGAFQLADDLQLPVVPLTIIGSFNILPRTGGFVSWHPMTLVVHKPIYPQSQGMENIKATMEEAYREIEKDLPEKYQGKIDNPDQDR